MKKINSVEAAFETAAPDCKPNEIEITNVPERHIEAVKAFAKLCVVHDAVNPNYQPDFTDGKPKFENLCYMGSPSGVGFSCGACADWRSCSPVGSRLVSESSEKANYIGETFEDLYKQMMVYERLSSKSKK